MSCCESGSDIIIQKVPASQWDVTIDWSQPERELGEDEIDTSEWAITGADDDLEYYDDTIASDKKSTKVWLRGGTVPNYYVVTNTVVTVGGRTLVQSFLIQMVPYIFITQQSCI